jgi:hypothetical protein
VLIECLSFVLHTKTRTKILTIVININKIKVNGSIKSDYLSANQDIEMATLFITCSHELYELYKS